MRIIKCYSKWAICCFIPAFWTVHIPILLRLFRRRSKQNLSSHTKKLTDAIDRAYLMSREEKTNIVRLITQEDGTIEISSSSTELGRVTEQIEVKEMNGEPLRIAFNSKYMLDALKVIDSEYIVYRIYRSDEPNHYQADRSSA